MLLEMIFFFHRQTLHMAIAVVTGINLTMNQLAPFQMRTLWCVVPSWHYMYKVLTMYRVHSNQLHAVTILKTSSSATPAVIIQSWFGHRNHLQLDHRENKVYTLVAKPAISFYGNCRGCMCTTPTTPTITMQCLHLNVTLW